MTHLDQPVSIFQGSTRVIPVETVSLHTVLDRIQDGTYRPYVERLRTILASQDQDAYSAAKRHSTAFTPAGTFTQRNNASVITLSGCLNFDMDHVPNLDHARSLLGADPHLLYLFVSPSGVGLKLGFTVSGCTDAATYRHAWLAVEHYLVATYPALAVSNDPACKDVSRLCYMSWDPDCYRNLAAQVYAVPPPMATPPPTPRPAPRVQRLPQDARERHAQRALTIAVRLIEDAPEHHQHHARLRAARLLGGYVAGGLLTYTEAYAALETPTEAQAKNVKAAMRTIVDGLEYGQAEPITLEELEAEWQAYRAQAYYRSGKPAPSIFTPPTTQEVQAWT